MKYLICFIVSLIISGVAFANGSMFDGMTKEQLQQYEIQVVDKKTGKVIGKMSRAEYKVVRIDSSREEQTKISLSGVKQYAKDIKKATELRKKELESYNKNHNSIILHAGVGKDGMSVGHSQDQYDVKEKSQFVAGLTGCRSYDGKGLCLSGFTNKTFTLGVKLDFK